jgi:PAS domain S-box-containing protein
MPESYEEVWRQFDAAIYIVRTQGDPLQGRVEFISAGTFRLLGYKPEQFIEDPGLWSRIMHPDDVVGVVEQTQEMFRLRQPRTRVYRLQHAVTKEYRWIEDSTVPLLDEQGNLTGIAGIARDITAIKQTDEELQRRQRQLEALVDAMPDAVVVADSSGRILQSNAAIERILGWSPAELAGQTVEVLIPEPLRSGHTRLRSRFAAQPQIRRMGMYELVALHKDGRHVPVDIMLGPIPGDGEGRTLVLIRDMTEYREAQGGLAYLSSIVKSSDDSIVGTDPDGVIVSWNHGAERLFGYTEEEAIGRHIIFTFPEDLQNECFDDLSRVAKRQHPPRYESRRVRKDGSQFYASVIVSPIEDSQGRLLGMSSICRDITARKQADAALEVAKRAAEVASQAKSEFLANMSHELRTPLNGIIGLTEIVLDSELTEEQRGHLNVAKDSAYSLLTILSDIIDMARIQSGKYLLRERHFWLRDLVDGVIREFAAAAQEKDLHLSWDIQRGVPAVLLGDANCLRQILSNLLGNAIKFTSSGEVSLSVDASPQDSGMLTFRVRDTGMGIPADQQSRIFEPFSQVDNSMRRKFGGTGLGLAICAQLAEMMGGRIRVESDGKSGSTFYFTVRLLPVTEPSPEALAEADTRARPFDRRREMRQPAGGPAQLKMLRPFSALALEGEVLDLSAGGAKVRVRRPLHAGALVQIQHRDAVNVAEVRYCLPVAGWFHLGLEFVAPEASQGSA